MKELIKSAKKRAEVLKKAVKIAEKEARKFPEGRLRVSNSGARLRYYKMDEFGETSGKYIPAENRELARTLAQKEYNSQFIRMAKAEIRRVEIFIERELQKGANLSYEKLSKSRKALVEPYILTDEMYARMWQDEYGGGNGLFPEDKRFATKRGEKVRSKSEAILADMFYDFGIPYHYEKPLVLSSGRTKYPDFTLLNIETREEIYWEHLGMLDDYDYRVDNLKKLNEYRENGVFSPKNLIVTCEIPEVPLDISGIRAMVKDLFPVA